MAMLYPNERANLRNVLLLLFAVAMAVGYACHAIESSAGAVPVRRVATQSLGLAPAGEALTLSGVSTPPLREADRAVRTIALQAASKGPAVYAATSATITTLASSAVAGQPGERHQSTALTGAQQGSEHGQWTAEGNAESHFTGRAGEARAAVAAREPRAFDAADGHRDRQARRRVASNHGAQADRASGAGARVARLLNAIAFTESRWRNDVTSRAGAVGVYQLLPSTAAALGVNPLDPVQARAGARRLLLRYWRRFGLERALYAYSWGVGRVQRGDRVPASVVLYADRVLTRAGMRRSSDNSEIMLAMKGSSRWAR